MKENTLLTPKKIIIGILLFIVIIAVTVTVLAVINMNQKKTSETTQTVTIVMPAKLITSYLAFNQSLAKQNNYTTQSTASSLIPSVTYKATSESFTLHLTPLNTASYVSTAATSADAESMFDSAAHFLIRNNFSQGKTNADSTTLFTSADNVCQVYNFLATKYVEASFGVSCVSQNTITGEYSSINSLLKLYAVSNKTPAITDITLTTHTKNNMMLTELYAVVPTATPSSFTMYFVTSNAKASYIGSQGTISIDDPTIPAPSSDLVTAYSDSKYGTLLTSNFTLNP
jgi:hypothetical protein